jgi:CRISPR/Cas system-associated endoribonuclease Cas2
MTDLLISYDLHNTRTYEPVWKKLTDWGAVRLLESIWVVSVKGSALAVLEELETVTDADDSIAVIELKAGAGWATIRAKPAGSQWLSRNIMA